MKTPFVDVEYHDGLMAGTSCRWSIVVGYEDKKHIEDSYAECYVVPVKPTKAQIRKLMKVARKMIRDAENDDAAFLTMIENMQAAS